MSRSAAAAMLLIGWLAAAGGACNALSGVDDIEFGGAPCTGDLACSDADPCTTETCGPDGVCAVTPVADGPAPQDQTSATDCVHIVCNGSTPVSTPDDSEVPDDDNACTEDACSGGVAMHTPQPGKPCAAGACDERGLCVGCKTPTDCEGADDGCAQRTCIDGVCGAAYSPVGTVLSPQVVGDCSKAVCDGSGGVTQVADETDVPPRDGNVCSTGMCVGTQPVQTPVAAGTPCPTGYCNGEGGCVECINDAQCPAALVCSSFICKKPIGQSCASGAECATTYCVDGFCCNEPCTGLCQACAGAKSIGQSGVCASIETGSDPDDECVAPAATTCCNSSTCGFC